MQEFMGRVTGQSADGRSNSQRIAELLAKQRARDKAEENQRRTTRDFREYHQAWQDYYKKYYEKVYGAAGSDTADPAGKNLNPAAASTDPASSAEPSADAAGEMQQLRAKIKKNSKERSRRLRNSKHFIPLMIGGVLLLFLLFVQFNAVFLGAVKAYVMPAKPAPGITELDPNALGAVGPETKLLIPKINVDVPINLGVDVSSHEAQMAAMTNGIMHFPIVGAEALPGEYGNFVVSGHSSNDAFTRGDYKFIFAKLDQLAEGDMIYVNYGGVRYTYVVRSSRVVEPTDVAALQIGTDRRMLTVITCTPLGTSRQRLLVFAEQIAPLDATTPPPSSETPLPADTAMPGNSDSLFGRFWNWLWGRG